MTATPILHSSNLQTIMQAESAKTSGSSGTSANSSSNSNSVGQVAQNALNTNLNEFLSLLTTEMQNQDPTQPMDNTTMMQQMATLSNLQIQNSTNSLLQSLLAQISSAQLNGVVGYIGKSVEAAGDSTALTNSRAELDYSLPTQAASVSVNIMDAAGNVVFSGPGTANAGSNKVFWNGANSTTGQTSPDGTYTYSVTAKDAAGKAITATTFTTGVVTAVDMNNGSPTLMMGTLSVPLSSVTQISQNPFTQSASSNAQTGG